MRTTTPTSVGGRLLLPLLFLLSSHFAQAQHNPHLCKIPANYVPSTTKGPIGDNLARTCNEWVSQYNNGVLSGEDFSAEYDCTGQSNDVVGAIEAIVGIGCCGGNSGPPKSACFLDRSNICKVQSNYEPFKQVNVNGHTQTCDSLVNNVNNGVLATQDFSAAYDCADKSNEVVRLINDVAVAGCCGGNSGAAKSTCWKENSHICKIPANYVASPTTKSANWGQNTGECGRSGVYCWCCWCCFC